MPVRMHIIPMIFFLDIFSCKKNIPNKQTNKYCSAVKGYANDNSVFRNAKTNGIVLPKYAVIAKNKVQLSGFLKLNFFDANFSNTAPVVVSSAVQSRSRIISGVILTPPHLRISFLVLSSLLYS